MATDSSTMENVQASSMNERSVDVIRAMRAHGAMRNAVRKVSCAASYVARTALGTRIWYRMANEAPRKTSFMTELYRET